MSKDKTEVYDSAILALKDFVSTVVATGGVTTLPSGLHACAADPDW